ncbi:MAG TPA: hypothetical protein VGC96_01265 [Candidatus Elarobacter sp.]|jgi:hypothetical protein
MKLFGKRARRVRSPLDGIELDSSARHAEHVEALRSMNERGVVMPDLRPGHGLVRVVHSLRLIV